MATRSSRHGGINQQGGNDLCMERVFFERIESGEVHIAELDNDLKKTKHLLNGFCWCDADVFVDEDVIWVCHLRIDWP